MKFLEKQRYRAKRGKNRHFSPCIGTFSIIIEYFAKIGGFFDYNRNFMVFCEFFRLQSKKISGGVGG